MQEYRAHFVADDGPFTKSVVLLCPDDEAAKERAKQLVDDYDIELWQLGRKVETSKHTPV
jgi:predicted dinucleotide-binding enzyme